jgi:thiamine kinase-like enzyme
MYKLLDEGPDRARIVAELGGPETMLHGDLWRKNILVVSTETGSQIRLIDWDATGVGPLTYDLSTLLYRSPAEHRPWILDRYQQSVAPLGWRMPLTRDLNLMLETAEISRLANSLLWVCVAAIDTQAEWVFDNMAEIERWFEAVEPAIGSV